VEKELLKEAELLGSEGLTEQELARSKAKIIGQKKIARQDLGSLAMATALDELYGLGFRHFDTEDARFQAVTLEQVKQTGRKYLRLDASVIATLKPDKPA
jgi:zinc protease